MQRIRNSGINNSATSPSAAPQRRRPRFEAGSSGQSAVHAPASPAHSSISPAIRHSAAASSSHPAASPERMKAQPLRPITSRTSKATMLVFSPLELTRSVTVSTISGVPPCSAA